MAGGEDTRNHPRRRVGRYYHYKDEPTESTRDISEPTTRGESWSVGYRHAAGDAVYKMPHVNLGMIAPNDREHEAARHADMLNTQLDRMYGGENNG